MSLLRDYIDRRYNGNVSAFARDFGFNPDRVYHWLAGRRVPDRRAALKISQRAKISLNHLLNV